MIEEIEEVIKAEEVEASKKKQMEEEKNPVMQVPPERKEQMQDRHFKGSPFHNAAQLNTFLLIFAVFATVAALAFVIQCVREISKGDDPP